MRRVFFTTHLKCGGFEKGHIRKLTKSETECGYLFISKDKDLKDFLNIDEFDIDIDGVIFKSRKIDSYGRIQIPFENLRRIGAWQIIRTSLVSRNKIKVEIVDTTR